MSKIVYSACFGRFSLSKKAQSRYKELGGKTDPERSWELDRTDPILVQVIEELGEEANTLYSNLRIEDLPTGTKYRIHEYEGNESIETIENIEWETA